MFCAEGTHSAITSTVCARILLCVLGYRTTSPGLSVFSRMACHVPVLICSIVSPLHVAQGKAPPPLYVASDRTPSPVRSTVNHTVRTVVLSCRRSIAYPCRALEDTSQPYMSVLFAHISFNCSARAARLDPEYLVACTWRRELFCVDVRTELQRGIVCTRSTVLSVHVVQGRTPPTLYLASYPTASPARSVANPGVCTVRTEPWYSYCLSASSRGGHLPTPVCTELPYFVACTWRRELFCAYGMH